MCWRADWALVNGGGVMAEFRVYKFHPNRLDPITVFVEQFSKTQSRMTVQCYAQSWTAYWGNHGDCTTEEFFLSCNSDYLADNLTWGWNGLLLKSREKLQREYLIRIVDAIRHHFIESKTK